MAKLYCKITGKLITDNFDPEFYGDLNYSNGKYYSVHPVFTIPLGTIRKKHITALRQNNLGAANLFILPIFLSFFNSELAENFPTKLSSSLTTKFAHYTIIRLADLYADLSEKEKQVWHRSIFKLGKSFSAISLTDLTYIYENLSKCSINFYSNSHRTELYERVLQNEKYFNKSLNETDFAEVKQRQNDFRTEFDKLEQEIRRENAAVRNANSRKQKSKSRKNQSVVGTGRQLSPELNTNLDLDFQKLTMLNFTYNRTIKETMDTFTYEQLSELYEEICAQDIPLELSFAQADLDLHFKDLFEHYGRNLQLLGLTIKRKTMTRKLLNKQELTFSLVDSFEEIESDPTVTPEKAQIKKSLARFL